MNRYATFLAAAAFSLAIATPASAQSPPPPAVPGYGAAKDVPNAAELPDPNMIYKVLFDVSKPAPKIDDVNPVLDMLARYVNTLDKWGVPPEHRKLAVIFHQGGDLLILNNAAYKARTGHDNPNIALIEKLSKAGVEFHACGQGVLANKVDPKTILPEINVDLWALVSIVNFEMRGYARLAN